MARSRRGPRTRLDAGERRALSALKKAGVYKPKGTPSPRNLHRKLRQPGMAEVAGGRAKAVKVGARAAREYVNFPRSKGRVIVGSRPGFKVYARKGEIYEVETYLDGRPVEDGEKRRFPRRLAPGEMPPEAPPGYGYTVTVNGNPSGVTFTRREQAMAFMREHYRRAMQAQRRDPEAIVVEVVFIKLTDYERIMERRDERIRQRRLEKNRRLRDRTRLLRAIRPFR